MIKAGLTSSAVLLFLRFSTSFSLLCSSGSSLITKVGQINKHPILVQGSYPGGFQLHGISTVRRDIGSQKPVLVGVQPVDWVLTT